MLRSSLKSDALAEVICYLAHGDADLFHGVSVTDGDAVVWLNALFRVSDGVKVNGDAVRGADFVLAAIPLANGSGYVIVQNKLLGQLFIKCGGLFVQLFGKRKDGCFIRSNGRVEMHNGADVVIAFLVLANHFFVIGFYQKGQEQTLYAKGWFNNIWNIAFVGFRIKVV